MKFTDGIFHRTFDRVAKEYSEIENEHWIVDIGAAKLADTPEAFDVVVMPNLYGDILSDVAAQIAGSVGLAGSANIGEHGAMFEAIHGSAPRRAGQNVANPSGLLLGAVMMLVHIGQADVAQRVHNAWLKTIEEGVHTYDIFSPPTSKQKVGTKEFANAVIARLGQLPQSLAAVVYKQSTKIDVSGYYKPAASGAEKALVGVDVFVNFESRQAEQLATQLVKCQGSSFELSLMTNRGVKVWPEGMKETFCTDQFRCRFKAKAPGAKGIAYAEVVALLGRIVESGLRFAKTEMLVNFDGEPGYTLGQGE